MAYVKTKMQRPDFVQVPTWFITDYMPKALSGYTKVYLYLLSLTFSNENEDIDLEEISGKLDLLYSELIKALHYWHEKKVIIFSEKENGDFDLEFILNKPEEMSIPSAKALTKAKAPLPAMKTFIKQTRPEYRTEEINVYLQDSEDVARLFKLAEQYLGRLLTITDQKILFSLYDWLHMPFDLIEYLIEYCVSNNHKAMHYIEKVAINWIDEGIVTLEQAKAKTLADKRYFKILNRLGSSKAVLTPPEKKCISKWLDTYKFSMEIILEACDRTTRQTTKPSLNYVDSILTNWYTDKVKTLDDIKALDKAFESKQMQQTSSSYSSGTVSNKIAKFNSMYSHNYDFDELEKLQEEHITRKLNGGN